MLRLEPSYFAAGILPYLYATEPERLEAKVLLLVKQ